MFDLRSRKAAAMVVVVDFLLAVLLMQQAILSLSTISQKSQPPRIETLGVYVIQISWPEDIPDDVDLYVEDPRGGIVYFGNDQEGLMHLERDDLGDSNDPGLKGVYNQERVILRGTKSGEYTVNVHMYSKKHVNSPTPVTVELIRLRGDDKTVKKVKLVLKFTGDEKTAFRFSLNDNQEITNINSLPKTFVGARGRI